jgi:hypothetical protein
VVSLVVGLFSVNVPAKTFIGLSFLLLLEGASVQVESVLAEPLGFYFFLRSLSLLQPLLFLHHFVVVDVVLTDLLIQGGPRVDHMCLVDL